MMVECKNCSKIFDNDTLYDGSRRGRSRRRSWCSRVCKGRSNNILDSSLDYRLKRNYNISLENYNQMVLDRDNKCDVCGAQDTTHGKTGTVFRLNIDHDHKCCPGFGSCGKCIRGLLCTPCNRGIGFLRDDPELILKSFQYLVGKGL